MKYLTRLATIALISLISALATPATATDAHPAQPLTGKFLVASRDIYGPYLNHKVIYVLQQNTDGAVGVIINQPLEKTAAEVMPELLYTPIRHYPVFYGGPGKSRIMVMLLRNIAATRLALPVSQGIYASSNLTLLGQVAAHRLPETSVRLLVGQLNWDSGALEQEVKNGYWHVADADPDAVFTKKPESLWPRLINRFDPQGLLL